MGEYWRFDSTGGQFHDSALSGEVLTDGAYEPLPLRRGTDGVVRGHSPVLGLELHWDDGRLRFYDPAEGEYMPDVVEANAQRDSAIYERESAIRERDSAVYERDSAVRERDSAAYERDSAIHERDAEAEARRKAEAELQSLREQIRRLRSE